MGFFLAQNVLLKQTVYLIFFVTVIFWFHEILKTAFCLEEVKLDSATYHNYKNTNLHSAAVRYEKWEVLSLL